MPKILLALLSCSETVIVDGHLLHSFITGAPPQGCVYTAVTHQQVFATRLSEPSTGNFDHHRPYCRVHHDDPFVDRYYDFDKFLDLNDVVADKGYQGLKLLNQRAGVECVIT